MSNAAAQGKAEKVPGVKFYIIRNVLKDKASGGGGGPGDKGGIPIEAIQAAEAEFNKMAEDYPDWVQSLIDELSENYRRCVDTPETRHENVATIHDIAHDMKGQGGTFGYDLISIVGESLFDFTESHKDGKIEDNHVELVRAHIDAMKAVFAGRITGDGGAVGTELLNSLEKAKEKYADVL